MDRLAQSFDIMKASRTPKNMWVASPNSGYGHIWIRDNFFIALSYLDKDCTTYEDTYHAMLDIYRDYEWKIDIHIKQKPREMWEYPHIRFDAKTHKEIDTPWAHAQNDAISCMLYGIGEGIKRGKKMLRDEKDREIIQKLVWYLNTLEYWNSPDSGYWEEAMELRASSIGSCIAGLQAVSDIVYVPAEMIRKGYAALHSLLPNETPTRDCDLALLCLIYPYNLLPKPMAQEIIHNIETKLLRSKGIIRYQGDSYFSTLEKEYGRNNPPEFYYGKEPHWVFGLSFLSLAYMTIGDLEKGKHYIEKVESLMLENGSLPELYFEGDYKDENGNNYNVNTPLLWTQSMYVQSVEMYEKISK